MASKNWPGPPPIYQKILDSAETRITQGQSLYINLSFNASRHSAGARKGWWMHHWTMYWSDDNAPAGELYHANKIDPNTGRPSTHFYSQKAKAVRDPLAGEKLICCLKLLDNKKKGNEGVHGSHLATACAMVQQLGEKLTNRSKFPPGEPAPREWDCVVYLKSVLFALENFRGADGKPVVRLPKPIHEILQAAWYCGDYFLDYGWKDGKRLIGARIVMNSTDWLTKFDPATMIPKYGLSEEIAVSKNAYYERMAAKDQSADTKRQQNRGLIPPASGAKGKAVVQASTSNGEGSFVRGAR